MKMNPVLYIAFWSGVAVTSLLGVLLSKAHRNVEAFNKYELKILLPKSSDGYFVQKACLTYVQPLLEKSC